MEFTLDSVTHAKEVLKQKLNVKNIKEIPIISLLSELETQQKNVYYFGVISVGENNISVIPVLHNLDIIKVDPSSQIILLFDSIRITKVNGEPIYPQGQFRGFKLISDFNQFVVPTY